MTAHKLRLLDALTRDARATPLDCRVFYFIASMINRATGDAWPRQTTIADALGITRRGVQLALGRLIALGYLTMEFQTGHKLVNRYRLGSEKAVGAVEGCESPFACLAGEVRTQTPEDANAETQTCEPPFAENPFNNPFMTPGREGCDLNGKEEEGRMVASEAKPDRAQTRKPEASRAGASQLPASNAAARNPAISSAETSMPETTNPKTCCVWIRCESPQADAWQRYWRAKGVLEPIRSGRTGYYVKPLPSEFPPGKPIPLDRVELPAFR